MLGKEPHNGYIYLFFLLLKRLNYYGFGGVRVWLNGFTSGKRRANSRVPQELMLGWIGLIILTNDLQEETEEHLQIHWLHSALLADSANSKDGRGWGLEAEFQHMQTYDSNKVMQNILRLTGSMLSITTQIQRHLRATAKYFLKTIN